jgi:lysyl-tRNA synthetase class 2
MEFYWAYADYEDGMRLVEELYRTIALAVYGRTKFSARGHTFDLADEWKRLDYITAVREYTGVDLDVATDEEIKEKLKSLNVKYE